jgi:hypothetical protein
MGVHRQPIVDVHVDPLAVVPETEANKTYTAKKKLEKLKNVFTHILLAKQGVIEWNDVLHELRLHGYGRGRRQEPAVGKIALLYVRA